VTAGACSPAWSDGEPPLECEILNQEAEALVWIRLDEPAGLDIDVDRTAVGEYVRRLRSG
jgi:hypothetical protein